MITVVVAVVVVVAVIVAVLASIHSAPVVESTTVPTTETTIPAATSTSKVPFGVTPVAQLLPHDVDATTGCSQNQSPPHLTGVSTALICTPANLPGGQIFAFQFDNSADYTSSLATLNVFKGFDTTTAGSACPPAGNSQDSIGWHSANFPSTRGQILECLSVGTDNSQPDYIWTYPSDNVIIDAQAAAHSSFFNLNNWWTTDSPPP